MSTKSKKIFNRKHHTLITLALASFFCFALITYTILRTTFPFDSSVQIMALGVRSLFLTGAMVFITNLASPLVLYLYSLLIYTALFARNKIHEGFIFILAMFTGAISFSLIKYWSEVSRPLIKITDVSGFSFPSGHVTLATIASLLTIYFFKDKIYNQLNRHIFIAIFALIVILIAFSRLYLGAHFFSDVLGGFFLGVGIVCLSCLYDYKKLI